MVLFTTEPQSIKENICLFVCLFVCLFQCLLACLFAFFLFLFKTRKNNSTMAGPG